MGLFIKDADGLTQTSGINGRRVDVESQTGEVELTGSRRKGSPSDPTPQIYGRGVGRTERTRLHVCVRSVPRGSDPRPKVRSRLAGECHS